MPQDARPCRDGGPPPGRSCPACNLQALCVLSTLSDYGCRDIRRRARHIGYVMQNPNQMISKTMIYDEVALGLQRSGLTEEQIREKVDATLRVCGLYPFRNWPISALSFGQKKRVTIAGVLAMEPKVLLLDEPSLGLAPLVVKQIFQILRELTAQGMTLFLVEQNARHALNLSDRAYVMVNGQIRLSGSGQTLLNDPEVRKAYLGISG